MAVNNEEYINQIYDASQKKQEASLKQNYDANVSALQASQEANRANTDANLNRTYVESAQQQKGFNEIQNAQGLSSGAMAQANLARDTQLQQDLTTLRAAQQSADADIERQRNLLGQQYAAAIQEAAANNDMERIKMLYQAAKDEDDKLTAQKQEAGKFIYQYNKNAIPYLQALGMTDEEIAALGITAKKKSSSGGSSGSGTGSGGGTGYKSAEQVVLEGMQSGAYNYQIKNALTSAGMSDSQAISAIKNTQNIIKTTAQQTASTLQAIQNKSR